MAGDRGGEGFSAYACAAGKVVIGGEIGGGLGVGGEEEGGGLGGGV